MHHIKSLTLTCQHCPTQYEGLTEHNQEVYIRYRHAELTLRIGNPLVHFSEPPQHTVTLPNDTHLTLTDILHYLYPHVTF